jgi:sugar lactone lactonase YvrE
MRNLCLCLLLANGAATATGAVISSADIATGRADGSIPKITVVADNLSWLENLVMDPATNSLFVSELKYGRVWKVTMGSNGTYTQEEWISNYTKILGLTKDPAKPGFLYGVGEHKNGSNVVFVASTTHPETQTVIAQTPKGHVGNGFGCHFKTGKLYTASEGAFTPGTGSVYEIDPESGEVTVISSQLWAADGLWIDQHRGLLYVGQCSNSKMFVWSIDAPGAAVSLGELSNGLGDAAFMDDFTLGRNGTSIVAASWTNSEIVEFPSFHTNNTFPISVLVGKSGLRHPTSARWGESAEGPFPDTALFITEGFAEDYLFPTKDHTSRLLRVDF